MTFTLYVWGMLFAYGFYVGAEDASKVSEEPKCKWTSWDTVFFVLVWPFSLGVAAGLAFGSMESKKKEIPS